MPNLTPSKLVDIRRKLVPVADKYARNVDGLLGIFRSKFEEFKGLVDTDTIIKIIETECEERLKIADETVGESEPVYDLNKDMERIQTDLTGHQIDETKIIKKNKRSIRMDSSFFEELEAFPPFLNVKNGIIFSLEIVDPTRKPRTHKSKNFNRDEVLWDVKLIDIKPKETLEKEDDKGRPIYQIGKIYSLSMGSKMQKKFKLFQMENNYEAVRFRYRRIGDSFQTDYIFTAL
jgi:hypothetical protein